MHLIWSIFGLLQTRTLSVPAHSHHVDPKATIVELCYDIIISLIPWKTVFLADLFPSFPTGGNRSALLLPRPWGRKKRLSPFPSACNYDHVCSGMKPATPQVKLHRVTAGGSSHHAARAADRNLYRAGCAKPQPQPSGTEQLIALVTCADPH